MPKPDGGINPDAPDLGAEVPVDGEVEITPDPEDTKGDHDEDDNVVIEGKDYTKKDLSKIIGIKRSLEKDNKALTAKVKEIADADLTAVELANKRATEAEEESAKMKTKLITEKAQRLLDAKVGPGKVDATYLNLGISSIEEVDDAVEKFIKASPGLKASPGNEEPPPVVPGDEPPPGEAPKAGSKESQLLADINNAQDEKQLAKAIKAADDWRKRTSTPGRRTI